MATTVRISAEALRILKLVSKTKGISLIEALDEITKAWERDHFFSEFNKAYATVREDAASWEAELEERKAWDATLLDDI